MRSTSLCLFVDGTEQDFPGLLAKASQHFTEVCVVDLSPDGASLEAATAGGALACRYRWSDHPSEALNTGLDLACGDWVLVASGSELERLDGEELSSWIEQHADAYGMGAPAQVGPLTLPSWRGLPAGSRFDGRDLDGVSPERAEVELPGCFAAASAAEPTNTEGAAPEATSETQEACQGFYEEGLALYQEERHEEALEVLCKAADLVELSMPFSAHLLETICWSMRALGRGEEALEFLDQVAGNFPDRLDTHFLLAVLCLDKKDFERAEIGFQTCRKLRDATPTGGPSEPSRGTYVALHNLGLLREMLDMPDEALEYYQLALGENPFYGPAREGVDRIAPQSASASGQS